MYQGPPTSSRPAPATSPTPSGSARPCDYVQRIGIDRTSPPTSTTLLDYATPGWPTIPGLRLVGTATEKASVLSFVLAGYAPHEVGQALNAEGIAVRAGHHCAQPVLRRFGLEATVRPSLAFYNTHEEIDVFLEAVRRHRRGRRKSRLNPVGVCCADPRCAVFAQVVVHFSGSGNIFSG